MKTFLLAFLLLLAAPAIAQTSSGYLDQSGSWKWEHDTGTPGSSTGQLIFGVASPSVDGAATEFLVSYSQYGGERFHMVFGNDTVATNFIYDTYVYLVNPTQVQNLELDVDQVTANGETIIFGTQCSSVSGTWEYTYASGGHAHWKPSNIACNPQNWKPNKWHHIQIQAHRVGDVVTYDWVKARQRESALLQESHRALRPFSWLDAPRSRADQLPGRRCIFEQRHDPGLLRPTASLALVKGSPRLRWNASRLDC